MTQKIMLAAIGYLAGVITVLLLVWVLPGREERLAKAFIAARAAYEQCQEAAKREANTFSFEELDRAARGGKIRLSELLDREAKNQERCRDQERRVDELALTLELFRRRR